jgi:hypothetical protein
LEKSTKTCIDCKRTFAVISVVLCLVALSVQAVAQARAPHHIADSRLTSSKSVSLTHTPLNLLMPQTTTDQVSISKSAESLSLSIDCYSSFSIIRMPHRLMSNNCSGWCNGDAVEAQDAKYADIVRLTASSDLPYAYISFPHTGWKKETGACAMDERLPDGWKVWEFVVYPSAEWLDSQEYVNTSQSTFQCQSRCYGQSDEEIWMVEHLSEMWPD